MARITWLFPKKRGVHRTGTALGGRVGEAAFFLSLFLLGVAGVIGIGWSYFARTWPVENLFPSAHYESAASVVRAVDMESTSDGDAPAYLPRLLLNFEVAEEEQSIWVDAGQPSADRAAAETLLAEYAVGDALTCWYDPRDPTRATIEPGSAWGLWLTVGLLVALGVFGAYGVIGTALQVGASVERRAALAQVANGRIDDSEELLPSARDYPTVPRDTNLLNSPGVKLKYRLPATQEPAWRLFGAAVWMLTCGALAVALAVVAVEQLLSGKSGWFLSGFALAVIGLAGWAVYNFLQELISASWMGPTGVEISAMPLHPGGVYEVYLNQYGNLKVQRLCVLLVCDEETTFLQGTDIRHDRQRVYQCEIRRREQFAIDATQPVEEHCRLEIPSTAMHSFRARYGAVQWKLVVEIEAENWPPYQRTFPIIVYPTEQGEGNSREGIA